jgi:hypothetical protein
MGRGSAAGIRTRCGTAGGRTATTTLVSGTRPTTVGGSGVVMMVFVVKVLLYVRGSATNRKAAGNISRGWGTRDVHRARRAADGRTDGHGGGNATVGGIQTGLNKVLALRLCDKGLELRGGEGVYQAGLGDNKEEDLGASQSRELIRLQKGKLGCGRIGKGCYLFHNACK